MSENEVRISVKVDNDTHAGLDSIKADFSTIGKSLSDLAEPLSGISTQFIKLVTIVPQLVGAIGTIGPAVIGALGDVAAQAGAAGAGIAALGLAIEPQVKAIMNASAAQDNYNKVVAEYGKSSKQAKDALEEYKSDIDSMPTATKQAYDAFEKFKDVLQSWSDKLAPKTMPILTTALNTLSLLLPKLTPLVSDVSIVIGQLMDQLYKNVKAGELDHFIQMFTEFSSESLQRIVIFVERLASDLKDIAVSPSFEKFMHFSSDSLQKIVNLVEELAIYIRGVIISPTFQHFMDQIKSDGPGIAQALGNIAQFLGRFIAASGPLSGLNVKVIETFANALNSIPTSVLNILAPILLSLAVSVKAITTATAIYNGVVNIANIVTKAWSIAMTALDAVMDANPIVLIGVAIVALVAIIVLIATKTQWFQDIWKAVWTAVKAVWDWFNANVIQPLVSFFTKTIPNAANTLASGISTAWNNIKSNVKAVYDWIVSNVINPIVNFFKTTIPNAAKSLASGVASGWNTLKNDIKSVYDWILNNIINPIINFFKNAIPNAAKSMASGVLSTVKSLASSIASIGSTVLKAIGLAHGGIVSGFAHGGYVGAAAGGGPRGNLTLVGENGPELVNLAPGTRVHSNPDTQRILGQSSGEQSITLYFDATPGSLEAVLLDVMRKSVRLKGGNVQAVLGRN